MCIQNTSLARKSTRAKPRRGACPAAPFSSHGDVVDQPRFADARGDQQPDWAVLQRADRRERLGMARLEIVERKPAALDGGSALVEHTGEKFSAREPPGTIPQHPVKRRRSRALL